MRSCREGSRKRDGLIAAFGPRSCFVCKEKAQPHFSSLSSSQSCHRLVISAQNVEGLVQATGAEPNVAEPQTRQTIGLINV